MSQNKKGFLRAIIFAMILLITLCILSVFARIRLRSMFNYEPFYDERENSIDVVFVGSSVCYCGISPTRLYEQYGISSQVFGSSNQSMLSTYLWAKEAYEKQKYKVLAIEVGTVKDPYNNPKRNIAAINSMGLSPRYFELAFCHKFKGVEVLLPVFPYHDFWKDIRKFDFDKYPNPEIIKLRGYVPLNSRLTNDDAKLLVDINNDQMTGMNTEYLDKTIDFCRENDIKVIFYKTPMINEGMWSSEWHNSIMEYAMGNDIEFIDFNTSEYFEDAGLLLMEDIAADGNHLNVSGAHKVTDWMGSYLTENTEVDFSLFDASDFFDEETINTYYQMLDDMD